MLRWQELFDDLESQLEHELAAEQLDVLAEEERLRIGRLALRDRLRAIATGDAGALTLVLRDGERVAPVVAAIGRDWVAGELEGNGVRRSMVVPLEAVRGILPSGPQLEAASGIGAPESPTELSGRLGLAFVLRDLCRRRRAVDLVLDVERLHGTIDRVGRDHLDLAEHPAGEPRRASAVDRVRIVPFDAVLFVRF